MRVPRGSSSSGVAEFVPTLSDLEATSRSRVTALPPDLQTHSFSIPYVYSALGFGVYAWRHVLLCVVMFVCECGQGGRV